MTPPLGTRLRRGVRSRVVAGLVRLVALIPLGPAVRIGAWLGGLGYHLFGERAGRRSPPGAGLPEKTEAERRDITRRMFVHLACRRWRSPRSAPTRTGSSGTWSCPAPSSRPPWPGARGSSSSPATRQLGADGPGRGQGGRAGLGGGQAGRRRRLMGLIQGGGRTGRSPRCGGRTPPRPGRSCGSSRRTASSGLLCGPGHQRAGAVGAVLRPAGPGRPGRLPTWPSGPGRRSWWGRATARASGRGTGFLFEVTENLLRPEAGRQGGRGAPDHGRAARRSWRTPSGATRPTGSGCNERWKTQNPQKSSKACARGLAWKECYRSRHLEAHGAAGGTVVFLILVTGCRPDRPGDQRRVVPEVTLDGVDFLVDRGG